MLEKIFESIVKSLENGNWLLLVGIVAFALIVNMRAIVDFYDRRNIRREESLKEALQLDVVSGATRLFVEEELNALVFKRATGIIAEKPLREKIRDLHERANGELSVFQFSRARKHLKLQDGQLVVQITRGDKIEAAFNWSMAALMAVFALLVFMLPSTIPNITLYQFVVLIGMSLLLAIFGMFLVMQTVPLSIARKIKPIIEKLEENSTFKSKIESNSLSKS